ncbi:MAG: FAD-binding oxidoreductase [Deltaproteobacteria bacterium]|nr:FAD-binding oxidoreductase [Deltaproteobacteria bacterium]
MNGKSADVVVIGGGIAGASIAYRLAEKGLRVILSEKERVGQQASGRAGGGVRQQNRHPAELPLAMEAIKIWAQMEEELGCDVEYRRCGNLRLLFTKEEFETFSKIMTREREMGLCVEMISPPELGQFLPAISTETGLIAAKYCATDGTANPLLVVKAICRTAQRRGVEIRELEAVRKLRIKNGKIQSAVTDAAEYHAEIFVNAAGPWARGICNLVGLDFPQQILRTPLLITEPLPPLIAPFISWEDMYLRQALAGNIHLGPQNIRAVTNFDISTHLNEFAHIGRHAPAIFPFLKQVNIIRAFCGLTHWTPDEIPILDRAPTISNFFLAAGFSGHGFCLGPVVGKLMAEWIVDGSSSLDLSGLNWSRFDSIMYHK